MNINRKRPDISPPEIQPKQDRVRQVRRYKLITPLFGGGAEPQQPDEVTVVRASEIRGLLRFWWRATRGGQFGSLDEMRRAEEAIWGSAAAEGKPGPSEVWLEVRDFKKGQLDVPFEVVHSKREKAVVNPRKGSVVPAYAAFPLQPKREEAYVGMELPGVYLDVEFTLHITFPEKRRQDVEAALWAWETFGGVGARTRRGFGALQLVELIENDQNKMPNAPKTPQQVKEWIRQTLREYVVKGNWPEHIPHLSQDLRFECTKPQRDALAAWQTLIGKLQQFRQQRHKKYGLSLWPEANVIRKRMGQKPKWPPNISSPSLVERFPRARFGLPIIFHMPHDKRLRSKDFTLMGSPEPDSDKPIDRLASPLILRPLVCGSQAVGLAVVLEAPQEPPYGLEVEGLPSGQKKVRTDLTEDDANTEPLKRVLNGEPDVTEAFLKTIPT